MRLNRVIRTKAPLVLALALSFAGRECVAQTNAFTYQGRLSDASGPVDGQYDFTFQLFDAPSSGSQVNLTITNANMAVSNGLFTVPLNFGTGAFPGAERWLQIGVRTNGSAGAYTLLSPRQAITATPYATFANTATTAAVAASLTPGATITVNGGSATNATFFPAATGLTALTVSNGVAVFGAGKGVDPIVVGTNLSIWTNSIAMPGFGAIYWPGMKVYGWPNHGGLNRPELIVESSYSIALFMTGMGGCQMGGSGPYHEDFHLQYDDDPYGVFAGYDYTGLYTNGHSKALNFIARTGYRNPGVGTNYVWSAATIMGLISSTNTIPFNDPRYGAVGDKIGFGELGFYTVPPTWVGAGQNGGPPFHPGITVGRMLTNGWNLRGKFVQQQASLGTMSSPTLALDFNSSVAQSVTLHSAVVRLYTTNTTGLNTDYERRLWFITAANAVNVSLVYPTDWNWVGVLQSNINAGSRLRLELESLGAGESHIIARSEAITAPQ